MGLALGAALAALTLPRWRRPWRVLAGVEAAVALLCLPIAFLPAWTAGLWGAMGTATLEGGAADGVKLMVSLACLLPPSVGMGLFLPIAAKALAVERAEGRALWLYATNTLGGVAGLALTAGWAVHAFGLTGAILAVCGANLLVVAGCLWLGRREGSAMPRAAEDERPVPVRTLPRTRAPIPRAACFALAAFSGAAVLASEILLIQQMQLVVPISFFGPAAMLALIILTLALAAAWAATPWFRTLPPRPLLGGVLALAGFAWVLGPWAFHEIASRFPGLAVAESAPGFLAKLVLLLGLGFGPALLLAGLVFPVSSILLHRSAPRATRDWGWLLAWNGLGAWLGAEATYRLLLPAVGLHGGFVVVACAYAGLAAIVSWPGTGRTRQRLIACGAAAGCLALGLGLTLRLPLVNPHVGFSLREVMHGRDGVVAVVDHPQLGRGILLSNQYLLGSTAARWSQERQAHLPLLLHPQPANVAFLGVATGSTPAAALDHPPVRSLVALELSPVVLDAARRHFPEFAGRLDADPRSRLVAEDGRLWFAAAKRQHDVVVGDLFLPWGPGEARLYSVEHFRAVRESLVEGGLFCQWLPGHQLTAEEFRVIAASFADVFGRVECFVDGFLPQAPSIALLGWRDGGLDWEVAERRCRELRAGGKVLDPSVRHAEALRLLHLATLPGPLPAAVPRNTLDNGWIEWTTGRRRLRGSRGAPALAPGGWLAWREGLPPATEAPPLARRLADAEARAWLLRQALAGRPEGEELWDALPIPIRADPGADWNRWPGSLRPPRRPTR